jgi:hypothetical protein
LSLGQVWYQYVKDLTGRSKPIKPSSMDSLQMARAKLKYWEERKARLITAQEILEQFDLHTLDKGHKNG